MASDKYMHFAPTSRRRFLRDTALVGGAALLSDGSAREVFAQDRDTTMVIAAPATPQSLDHEFDVSLGAPPFIEVSPWIHRSYTVHTPCTPSKTGPFGHAPVQLTGSAVT